MKAGARAGQWLLLDRAQVRAVSSHGGPASGCGRFGGWKMSPEYSVFSGLLSLSSPKPSGCMYGYCPSLSVVPLRE